MTMTGLDKQELLRIISESLGSGMAENESKEEREYMKNFLPIPDHRRAIDPNILLILGGRGAGKTELFQLLAFPKGRAALLQQTGSRAWSYLDKAIWVTGYGHPKQQGKKYSIFPTAESIEMFSRTADTIDWRAYWIGLMLGSILKQEGQMLSSDVLDEIPSQILEVLTKQLQLLKKWHPIVKEELELLNYVLDRLDEKMIEEDRWLFITYDELDKLTVSHAQLSAPIRELLAFWLDRWRRWERIRPKIFLRTDLFGAEFLGFPDASKLQAYQIRLEWQASWLYQLLMKRLANSDERMLNYLRKVPHVIVKEDPILGYIPGTDETLYQELMRVMVGQYMGKDAKKGITYRWIPNHLQDANGRIAPRSFLKLFERAAKLELERFSLGQLPEERLLQPTHLQGALMETSEDRIRELAEEEYPWLNDLKPNLEGLEVPAPKSSLLQAISRTNWSQDKQLPATDPEEIFQYLLKLGILENRSDGRVNMPDIYLYGFKMRRRGGIRRPV
jgi:hypothetical protein